MTDENIRFRIASQDDTTSLKQLIELAFRAEDSREGWVGNSDLASRFSIDEAIVASVITNPDSAFLIASDSDGTFLGTIGVSKRDPDTARLFMLAVDPRHHRGGIGRQTLTYAENYFQREWAPRILKLDALSNRESLMSWYLRRGFQKTGESTPFPRGEFKDLDLPDDMRFVQFEKVVGPDYGAEPAV